MHIQKVNKLNQSEIDQIVNLHHSVLKESFLNNFGKKFLKIAYQTIIPSKNNICLIAEDKNTIIGYTIVTYDGEKFNKEVIYKNFFSLNFIILSKSILNPNLLLKVIRWIIKPPNQNKIKPEIQFIAINPNYQNQGLGTKFINEVNKEFKNSNIKSYRVGTKTNNEKSNNFYKKLSFTKLYEDDFFGDKFNYYLSPKL